MKIMHAFEYEKWIQCECEGHVEDLLKLKNGSPL